MPEEYATPLDEALTKLSLKNDDLVRASSEQLTFKQVQKARRGKSVTPNIQGKITRALNAVLGEQRYTGRELFCGQKKKNNGDILS